MRTTIDFSPLWRTGIGFDRMLDLLDNVASFEPSDHYPPYNIEKTGEDAYRVTLAVAGFAPDELTVTAQPNLLLVAGRKAEGQGGEFLHHGIATRPFERQFRLADYVKVASARLENGLLTVDLVREVPETMKPRRIEIASGSDIRSIERKKAA